MRGSSGVERMNGRAQSPLPCLIVARDDKKAGCNNLSFHVFATTQVSGVLPIALLAAICTLCSPNGDFNLFEGVLLATQTKSKSTLQQRREKKKNKAEEEKKEGQTTNKAARSRCLLSSPFLHDTIPTMSSKVSRDWRGIEEVGELDGRAFHGLTNLSVWTLSSCLFCFRMCVCVQKKTSTKARPTKPTQFRYFYERGDFPIALGHSTRGNIIQCQCSRGVQT